MQSRARSASATSTAPLARTVATRQGRRRLSVALRVAGPWSLGGGLRFGWEEHLHELETDLLAHAQLFVRHQDLEELFVDLGVTAGRYDRVDDRAGDCSHAACGWMAGLYVEPNLGYRWVFAALRLRLVLADDLSNNRFTFVLTPMIRGLISW